MDDEVKATPPHDEHTEEEKGQEEPSEAQVEAEEPASSHISDGESLVAEKPEVVEPEGEDPTHEDESLDTQGQDIEIPPVEEDDAATDHENEIESADIETSHHDDDSVLSITSDDAEQIETNHPDTEEIPSHEEPQTLEAVDECQPDTDKADADAQTLPTDDGSPSEHIISAECQDAEEHAEDVTEDVHLEEQQHHDSEEHVQDSVIEDTLVEEDNESAGEESFLDDLHDESLSRRTSASSHRRTSLRTEALIQAAARAVVAKIEVRDGNSHRSSVRSVTLSEDEPPPTANTEMDTPSSDTKEASYDRDEAASANSSRRESSESMVHHVSSAPRSLFGDEGGDSSSHHEPDEDDVFSDNRSSRSSISGSYDGRSSHSGDHTLKSPLSDTFRGEKFASTRSPRVSGVSIISGISQYEKEEAEFVPTTRNTPRMPFRTPSNVRALQMSSPAPSIFNGSDSRSHQKKRSHGGSSNFPTISRLGSPIMSAQFSPKGRTPTRFKPRQEAPLVLLHVTLLPLRWMWGDVINNIDTVTHKGTKAEHGRGGAGVKPDLSVPLRSLREAWRQLQDRVGDTVLERGILLPHPQNDYEVLEERLLEALDLPLRRRARILECGHYVGPANLSADDEFSQDEDSENEYGSHPRSSLSKADKRHWCATCKSEIKFEDLGPGKIFRVKVYASNGLMRAGAWDACWKEMERVDIEVEPVVESAIQGELERMATLQDEADYELTDDENQGAEEVPETDLPAHLSSEVARVRRSSTLRAPDLSSPLPSNLNNALHASPLQPPASAISQLGTSSYESTSRATPMTSLPPLEPPSSREPFDESEARRIRDEERMREIYGDNEPYPPAATHHHASSPSSSMRAEQATTSPRHPDSYIPPPSPRSPSEEAFERREARDNVRRPYQSASLPELLLEVVRVLMRDPKNVAIVALCILAMFLVVRPSPSQLPQQDLGRYEHVVEQHLTTQVPAVDMTTTSVLTEVGAIAQTPVEMQEEAVVAASLSASSREKETKIIRIVETVTETVDQEPALETIYETETVKVTVSSQPFVSTAESPSPTSTKTVELEDKILAAVEESRVAEEYRVAEESRVAVESRVAEEYQVAVESRAAEVSRVAEDRQLHDEI